MPSVEDQATRGSDRSEEFDTSRLEEEGTASPPAGARGPTDAPEPHYYGGEYGATLFGFDAGSLFGIGIGLGVIGALIAIGSFIGFASAPPGEVNPWFMVTFLTGGVLVGLAAWALRFALIGPVSSYVASEASPALQIASAALARGVSDQETYELPLDRDHSKDGGDRSGDARTLVKVKCRTCGHLNEEDATYCDKCGKSL